MHGIGSKDRIGSRGLGSGSGGGGLAIWLYDWNSKRWSRANGIEGPRTRLI